jgi:CspA family cold shock protein
MRKTPLSLVKVGNKGNCHGARKDSLYSVNLGHGFIIPDAEGPNVFVRRENIVASEERTLKNNDLVSYEVTQSEEGPEAKNVSKV